MVGRNIEKCDMQFLTAALAPPFYEKHSRDYSKIWRWGYQHFRLKYLEVNIENIIIVFWVKEFQEMVHFLVTNWFYCSGVWIWKWSRLRFKWKLWRLNLNITIINDMMIKSPHDSWKHRTGFGRRCPLLEASCWRLAVTLYWGIRWFVTMDGIALIHLFSQTLFEEVRATDDAGISLV